MSRPLEPKSGNDTGWESANPIDPLTGLLQNHDPQNIKYSNDDENSAIPPLWCHMFSHGMTSSLLSKTHELYSPILMVEKSYNPPAIRQKVTEILFEYFNAPAVFLARDAVLSCYACGRTTGVVVDFGSSGTTVSPVYEGFVESRGVIRSPMGTTVAIDEYALKDLDKLHGKETHPMYQVRTKGKKRSDIFHRLCRLDMAKNMREEIALVADIGYDPAANSNDEPNSNSNSKHLPKLPYRLPDGSIIDVECETRYNIVEVLFGRDDHNTILREEACQKHKNRSAAAAAAASTAAAAAAAPSSNQENNKSNATVSTSAKLENMQNNHSSLFNPVMPPSFTPPPLSSHPIPNIICDAAFQCDRDQQAQLLSNVIISGGGSCMHNFPDRIRDEVEGIIHTHTPGWKVKVLAPPIPERSVSAWLGGSILASLGSFGEMWMTRKEYEDGGCSIVNRKCP